MVTVICLLMEKKSINLKQIIKNINFANKFCRGSISNKCAAEKVLLKSNVYDFSLEYDTINKFDLLNIHKFSMTENSVK